MDGVAQENKKTETESTINELDKFLGPDMKNVEVEELDNKVIENEVIRKIILLIAPSDRK